MNLLMYVTLHMLTIAVLTVLESQHLCQYPARLAMEILLMLYCAKRGRLYMKIFVRVEITGVRRVVNSVELVLKVRIKNEL